MSSWRALCTIRGDDAMENVEVKKRLLRLKRTIKTFERKFEKEHGRRSTEVSARSPQDRRVLVCGEVGSRTPCPGAWQWSVA